MTEQEPNASSLEKGPLLRRLNLPFLIVAMFTGFIALGNEAWWVVEGVGSNSILKVGVSPFYVEISAIGVPPTVPYALILGSVTRVLLAVTTLALALGAFWPKTVWRKPVFWLSLSTLMELYLSFALLLHSAQVTLLDAYGTIPPLSGNAVIQGRITGLDFSTFLNPTISSTITAPFFLGLASIALLGGSETLRFLLNPKFEPITSELMKGLSGVYLSPPYQHAWFTSTDQSLNPLNQDPDNLADDELATSFERLLERMQPGGLVSIILPAWAGGLNDRLVRVVPWTGFHLEKSELIYRVPGKPENELVFRKPAGTRLVKQEQAAGELSTPIETVAVGAAEVEAPPLTDVIEEPLWAEPQLSRREMAMVKSAVSAIERRKGPVPYKELLNEVYMDLLDKKVNFESAKQIETTLVKHIGRELAIIEDLDEVSAKIVRNWWLGERALHNEKRSVNLWTRLSNAKRRIPKVKELLVKWPRRQHSGYRPRRHADQD